VPKEIFSYSLMTTLSALQDGSSPLLKHSSLSQALEVFRDLVPLLQSFEGTGTYSVSNSSSKCTIEFFVEEDNICLDILCHQEHGLQELVTKTANMMEKLSFSKLAICLSMLNFFMLLAVLTKLI